MICHNSKILNKTCFQVFSRTKSFPLGMILCSSYLSASEITVLLFESTFYLIKGPHLQLDKDALFELVRLL